MHSYSITMYHSTLRGKQYELQAKTGLTRFKSTCSHDIGRSPPMGCFSIAMYTMITTLSHMYNMVAYSCTCTCTRQ